MRKKAWFDFERNSMYNNDFAIVTDCSLNRIDFTIELGLSYKLGLLMRFTSLLNKHSSGTIQILTPLFFGVFLKLVFSERSFSKESPLTFVE